MKQTPKFFLRFDVEYYDCHDRKRAFTYYGEITSNCKFKIFNPCFKVADQKKKNFFSTKVTPWVTSKGRYVLNEDDIANAFVEKMIKLDFDGFKPWQIDSGIAPDKLTRIRMSVKLIDHYQTLHRIVIEKDRLCMSATTAGSRAFVTEYGMDVQLIEKEKELLS